MDEATTNPQSTRAGWKYPLAILIGGAGLVAFAYFNPFVPDKGHQVLGAQIAGLVTVAAFLSWSWRALRQRGGRGHHVLAGVVVLVVIGLIGTLRLRYLGDLYVWPQPRPWVYSALRKVGVTFPHDVMHTSRLAEPPLVLASTPDDVTRFLGPNGDGRFQFAPGRLARDWLKNPPRELWRVKVGPGWSSFAVVGNYGFTQEQTSDLAFEQVTCYDLTDGSLKWVHGDGVVFSSSMGGDGPRATPTYFNGKLVTVGGQGLLNCFDAATGKLFWSRDAVTENDSAPPMWGLSSSAFAFHSDKHGDVVVMSPGGAGGKSLHAYRLDDGKEIWSVGDDAAGYATPDLKTIAGVPQIVVLQWQAVSGHDPDTGAELWRYNDPHDWETINPKVAQPIVLDDRRVLLSAGYGTGCILLEFTKQADGKLTYEKKWRSTKLKPKFTNLVVRDGYVYGLDDGAFLVCLDLANGDLKWRSKRGADYGHGQILLVDDLLIVQSETGDVALVEANPKSFNELGRFTALPDGVSWNQPVVTGRKLLVRNDKEAACYELPAE